MPVQSKPQYEVKVYKIWYEDAPEECYIGSTKHDALSKRMGVHRNDAKRGRKAKIFETIREKGGDFKYCQIASCMVSCKDEQCAFEQEWIDRLNPILNMRRARGQDIERDKQKKKEYRQRPEVKQKSKEYSQSTEVKQKCMEYYQKPGVKQRIKEYQNKPEVQQKKKERDRSAEYKLKQKERRDKQIRTCVCGVEYLATQYRAQQHYQTGWHQEFIAGLPFPFNGGRR